MLSCCKQLSHVDKWYPGTKSEGTVRRSHAGSGLLKSPNYSRYREWLFQDHNMEGVFVIPVINLKPVFKKTDTHRKKKKLSLGLLNVEN